MTEKITPPEKEGWPVLETDLARRTGLTLDALRELRKTHLVRDVDYSTRGRRIAYSATAAADLVELAGLPANTAEKAATGPVRAVRGALPPLPGAVLELVVWRAWRHGITNVRILEAHFKGANPEDRINVVRVRVSDNRGFNRGMEIWGRLEQADLYEHWDPERNLPGASPR